MRSGTVVAAAEVTAAWQQPKPIAQQVPSQPSVLLPRACAAPARTLIDVAGGAANGMADGLAASLTVGLTDAGARAAAGIRA